MIFSRALWSGCWLACFALIAVAGCGNAENPPAPTGKGGAASKGSTAKDDTTATDKLPELKGDVKLEAASWDDIQAKIAGHKGKVVVVDIWSNYCTPCLRELPGLVKLQRMYPDDVVCISVNTNYGGIPPEGPTDENKKEALEVLEKIGAKIENYLSSVADEILLDQMLHTTLPSVMVYDREGKLVKTFNNDKKEYGPEFSYAKHVEPYVKEQVAAKPAAAGN